MTNKKSTISLYDLGFCPEFEEFKTQLNNLQIARVITEHKERYIVKNENGEYDAELIGNLRYSAQSKLSFPAVGDWVAISAYDDDKALIHSVAERKNTLKRQAIGKDGEEQIIATNIDYAFIVEAINRDFSINRFQRYLTLCFEANIEPILILNKTDLLDDDELKRLINLVKDRLPNIKLFTASCINSIGLDSISELVIAQKTYCFLGSSGVGKSTLINMLSGGEMMKTDGISEITDRGKHTTTHRELIVLKQGGVLIDNPGMREVGITQTKNSLESSFQLISTLADNCRFKDCVHIHEKGCAVLQAVKDDELDVNDYNNYLKIQREQQHFEASQLERKQKGKNLSKMIKQVKNKRTR